jgi:hypothetical protein
MSSTAIRRAPPSNQVSASVITAQVFNLASNAALPTTVAAPGKLALEGKSFNIRAEGNAFTTVATYTAKLSLLGALVVPASPLVATNWTLLGSGTARIIAATWAPWWIEAKCMYDSNSGLLAGVFQQMVNNLFDANVALTATLTGLNGTNQTVTQGATPVPPADPVAVFAVAITFSIAAANLANLFNFELAF